jgi:PAS domain S-box-containing protein
VVASDARSLPVGAGYGLPPAAQRAYAAALVFLAYYAGAKLGLALTLSPSPISVLWPPNATLLAALLIAPFRLWPLMLAAAFPAHLLAELQGGVPPVMVLSWFVSNVTEALIGALCVRRLVGGHMKLDSVREVGIFLVFAGFLAPFVSSFIDAGFVTLIGWGTSSYADLWKTRFFSNVLATLTIVPAILTCVRAGLLPLRNARLTQIAEGALLAAGLLLATVIAFAIDLSTPGVPSALLYLPLPFLFWAALRFGPAGSSLAFALVAFLAIWGAAHGHGPFSSIAPRDSAHAMQFLLTFIAVTFLALAAFVQERQKAEAKLRSSEERFATAFHSSPDAMAISRKSDGRFIEVNERWLSMFGHERHRVVGHTIDELNFFSDMNQRDKAYALANEQGAVHELELELRTAAGEVLHTHVATRAVEMEGERRFITMIRDDTERRRAEVALRESEARFRSLADTAPVMIWMAGLDKQCSFFNKGWLDFTGRTLKQELGYGWAQAVHSYDVERCVGTYARAFDARQPFAMDYRLRRRDGSYRWVTDTGVPRTASDGTFLGYIGTCVDITDSYELQRSRQALAHGARISMMGELAASLAHELSQPLTAITANVQATQRFIRNGAMDVAELGAIVDDIAQASSRAGEVIQRMRSLARKGELEVVQLDVSSVVREVGVLLQTDTIVRGVHLSIAADDGLRVRGDKVQLQQVMLNLLLNAFDAVKEVPASEREVTVCAEREDDTVRVRVSDRGPGLTTENLDRIFTPFYTSKRDGVGLGLSISRSIIEAHGGHLTAANNASRGATFEFALPVDEQSPPSHLG